MSHATRWWPPWWIARRRGWGSLWARREGRASLGAVLSEWPVARPPDWLRRVNRPLTESETERFQTCMARNRPYGDEDWQSEQAEQLGLQHAMRSEGQPKSIDRH